MEQILWFLFGFFSFPIAFIGLLVALHYAPGLDLTRFDGKNLPGMTGWTAGARWPSRGEAYSRLQVGRVRALDVDAIPTDFGRWTALPTFAYRYGIDKAADFRRVSRFCSIRWRGFFGSAAYICPNPDWSEVETYEAEKEAEWQATKAEILARCDGGP